MQATKTTNTFQLEVTLDDLRLFDEALVELPFKRVVGLINKINEQMRIQMPQPSATAPAEIPGGGLWPTLDTGTPE